MKLKQSHQSHSSKVFYTLNGSRRNRGIMLIDCLVYIAGWMAITGLIFTAFYRSLSFSQRLSRSSEDIAYALQAGERWRQDIRSPSSVISVEQEASSSDQVLAIASPHGKTLYLFSRETLYRKSRPDEPWVKILSNIRSSKMLKDSRSKVLAWKWELELKAQDPKARLHPLFTFLAVPK